MANTTHGKFTSPRIMTPDEARARATEMGLSEELIQYLVNQFEENKDAPVKPQSYWGPYVGANGKIAWGQSWESAAEDLAEAMGKEPEAGLYGEDPEFERVWEAFFEE